MGLVVLASAGAAGAHVYAATCEPVAPAAPPGAAPPRPLAEPDARGVRRSGRGVRAELRGVDVVRLAGPPAELGAELVALLGDRMREDEGVMWRGFEHLVPSRIVRAALLDFGRIRHRHLALDVPAPRLEELAAEARAFAPVDPYAGRMATFPRHLLLHAAYDASLAFEKSPILGCTSLVVGPSRSASGHPLLARAFDMELTERFDTHKVVYLVEEEGRVPFASVAWPGVVGVVSGMNAHGVAAVVHGARAGEPAARGVPVLFSLREALSLATSAADAAKRLANEPVMVSHLVLVADATGDARVVERAPGVPAHVRALGEAGSLTNHFEGPLAADPRDAEVRRQTTTLARAARATELLDPRGRVGADPGRDAEKLTPRDLLGLLRDHGCAGGEACPPGDRRSLDAFLATHGVVADLAARTLWVSAGPKLSGHFVAFDLARAFDPARAATDDDPLALGSAASDDLPEDPALHDGRFDEGTRRVGPPLFGEDHP